MGMYLPYFRVGVIFSEKFIVILYIYYAGVERTLPNEGVELHIPGYGAVQSIAGHYLFYIAEELAVKSSEPNGSEFKMIQFTDI